MRYEDFTIRILSGSQGEYRVFVSCPIGSDEAAFTLPYAREDLPAVVAAVALHARSTAAGPAGGRRDFAPLPTAASPPSRDCAVVGAELYAALFHGRVKEMLAASQARLGTSGTGLRIRLEMNLRGEGMKEIASLPWELMRPGVADTPLAVSTHTAVVRVIDVLRPADHEPFMPPLNVLVIISNPTGTEPLDLEQEEQRIRTSWATLDGVDVTFVKPQVAAINDAFSRHNFHVIHYMGHGDFDPVTGHGLLFLENDDGTPDALDSARLRAVFGEESKHLRLVFLNACKTAVSSDRQHQDSFAGIATTLIGLGVPAVVAMQFPITDDAAVEFAGTFYRRLVEGKPIDAAVAGARLELFTRGTTRAEWATPVLFMRSKHGDLFQAAAATDIASRHDWARPGRLALLAAPTLVLLALLVGANYVRVATAVTLQVVAAKVAFDIQGEGARMLLSRSSPFSELRIESCESMSLVTASLAALAPVALADSPPGPHTFRCTSGSTITLRDPAGARARIGSLGQVRADAGANVVLSVAGGRAPELTVDVATGQELSVPISEEFEIATTQTDLSAPPLPDDTRVALRSGLSRYRARLAEGRRTVEIRTPGRTVLVVVPVLEPEAPIDLSLTDADTPPLSVQALQFSGAETLGDSRTPLVSGTLRYADFPTAPPQDLADRHLVLGPGTAVTIRRLAITPEGLALDLDGRVAAPSAVRILDGAVVHDPRLTALQRIYYGPGSVVALASAATLWLAATLGAWWALDRRTGRASAGAARATAAVRSR